MCNFKLCCYPPHLGMLDLVNRQRIRNGLNSLVENRSLMQAAQGHSDFMASRNDHSHQVQGEDPLMARVRSAGFRLSSVAENIGKGYDSVDAAMEGWMRSDGHRNNILNARYTHFGWGLRYRGQTPFWTQVFAS